VLALAAVRKAPALCVVAVAYYVVHAVIPHKELRFLFPVLPILCALAAVGTQQLYDWKPRAGWAAAAVALVASVLSAELFPRLTFRDLGINDPNHPSAFDRGGPESRL